jgi:MFS family permease
MNRSFIAYLAIRALTSAVSTITSVAVGWHVYELTNDPFALAMIGLVHIAPLLSLFIFSGLVVDRFPRRLVIATCIGSEAILYALLALVMSGHNIEVNHVYLVLFAVGCSRAFYRPAQDAILPNLVSKAQLSKAVSTNGVVLNIASTVGPFVAGYLLLWFDRDVYKILALFPTISFLLVWQLPIFKGLRPTGKGLAQVLGGIHFIKNNRIVLGSISLDLFIVMVGSVVSLLPIYVADILKVGPESLGILRGMPALGAVSVGLFLTRYPLTKNVGWVLFVALVIFSLSVIVFAYSTVFWVSLAALWVYGGSDMVSVNVRSALVHLATPDDLRGRVSAVNTIFISSSNQFGDFRAGSVASVLSPVATVALGGFMALAVAVGGAMVFPQIRKMDKLEEASARG